MNYVQAAISDIYAKYILDAAELTGIPLPFVPNNKFTILTLGQASTGKSSLVNYLIG